MERVFILALDPGLESTPRTHCLRPGPCWEKAHHLQLPNLQGVSRSQHLVHSSSQRRQTMSVMDTAGTLYRPGSQTCPFAKHIRVCYMKSLILGEFGEEIWKHFFFSVFYPFGNTFFFNITFYFVDSHAA